MRKCRSVKYNDVWLDGDYAALPPLACYQANCKLLQPVLY